MLKGSKIFVAEPRRERGEGGRRGSALNLTTRKILNDLSASAKAMFRHSGPLLPRKFEPGETELNRRSA